MSAIAPGVQDLRTSLDKFIEKYVCCENCPSATEGSMPGHGGPWRAMAGHGGPWQLCWGHLPEIDMYVKKGIIQVEILSSQWGRWMIANDGDGSKAWYRMWTPSHSWDLWMFIPLKCIYRYWPIPWYHTLIKGSLGGETSVLRTFRMSGK